jgi:hypothetical protein
MEMKKVLKVILIRSGILISLLVVLIMAIKTMVQVGPLEPPKQQKVLAVLRTEPIQEDELHLRGIKDGMVFNGLQYTTKIYALPSLIRMANLVYIMSPCQAEEILAENGKKFPYPIIGYSFIKEPRENYTGIYCDLDWQKVLPIYQKILPNMKRIGIIYTQDSCDGERQALSLKSITELRPHLNVYIQTLDHYGEDIDKILFELFENVDAIYAVARDKIIQNKMEMIAEMCMQNRIPLIGGGIYGPQMGALASLAFDPYRIGRKGADMIRALEQIDQISKIEITKLEPGLYLNLRTAYSLGLEIPSDLRKLAQKVYN